MSNPPRRSKPRKPGATIDLASSPTPSVGYPGPITSAEERGETSHEAAAPLEAEGRVVDAASAGRDASLDAATHADTTEKHAGPTDPAVDGGTRRRSAAEGFAEEESPTGTPASERSSRELDDTILSAAVPDFVAGDDQDAPTGPPPPTFDYTQTTPPPAESRGGFGSAFGGALLGAVLALAGAGALQYSGAIPALGGADNAEELAQFARTGDVQQVTTDLGTLRTEVEQLRSAQAAGGTGGGVSSAELTTVVDRVTALEQRGEQGAASGAVNEEAAAGAQAAAERAAEVAEAARLAAEAGGTAAGVAKAAADQSREVADQSRQAADESRQVADQSRQVADTANQAANAAQQAASTAQQAASGAQTAANTANEAIAAFEERLAAIETANREAGIALSAAALKVAIDRGGPFMSELEGFATAAGPTPAVETLRGFAAEGVPSAQALASTWPEVESRIAEALRPAVPQGDVGVQIFSGLSALVTSRPSADAAPAEPAAGEGPSAVLGRLSTAVSSGELQAFLDAWETLPQEAKDVSGDFKTEVEARVRTDAVVGETLNSAVNASATRS